MGLLILLLIIGGLTTPYFIMKKIKTLRDFKEMCSPLEDIAVGYGYKRGIITTQIALETGYGKKIIDNNLFNIKATGGWLTSDNFIEVITHEYIKGVKTKVIAKFRKYTSYENSLYDYINLISKLSRYTQAWLNRHNEKEYFKGLVAGGYATDLVYAEKLENIFSTLIA